MVATYLLIGCVVGIALACFAIVLLLERRNEFWREYQQRQERLSDRYFDNAQKREQQKPRVIRR